MNVNEMIHKMGAEAERATSRESQSEARGIIDRGDNIDERSRSGITRE
jgi:hypothetical protein